MASRRSSRSAAQGRIDLEKYLLKHSSAYQRLQHVRSRFGHSDAQEFYANCHNTAKKATLEQKYRGNHAIAQELDENTQCFSEHQDSGRPINVLDICMAPGGFSHCITQVLPVSQVHAITLPPDAGGDIVLLKDDRLDVQYVDVSLLESEMREETDSPQHSIDPETDAKLIDKWPFPHVEYDITICDGQPADNMDGTPSERSKRTQELWQSQLTVALSHIKLGGTMIIYLMKPFSELTFNIVEQFSRFSNLKLYKPKDMIDNLVSFYMVASSVDIHHSTAAHMLSVSRKLWRRSVLGTNEVVPVRLSEINAGVLNTFGEQYISLCAGIWQSQADILEQAAIREENRLHSDIRRESLGQLIDLD